MKAIQRGAAAAAFSIAAILPARAEETKNLEYANLPAEKVFIDPELSTTMFVLHDTKLGGDTIVSERSRVDEAIGITCEWRVQGNVKSGADGKLSVSNVQKLSGQCVEGTSIPEAWKVSEPEDFSGDVQAFIVQKRGAPETFYEGSESVSGSGIVTRYLRTWDTVANKVCLDIQEGTRAENEPFKAYFDNDWGCFPIKNEAYLQTIYDHFGIKGPF